MKKCSKLIKLNKLQSRIVKTLEATKDKNLHEAKMLSFNIFGY